VHEDILPAAVPNDETEPLAVLYHFTVPISWTLASKGCRSDGDLKLFRGGLGGAALLLSTLMISVTCRVRCPGSHPQLECLARPQGADADPSSAVA
jgi:hypothetical protein